MSLTLTKSTNRSITKYDPIVLRFDWLLQIVSNPDELKEVRELELMYHSGEMENDKHLKTWRIAFSILFGPITLMLLIAIWAAMPP